jgi:hypothetical protein
MKSTYQDINDFTQVKVFFLMPFVTNDKDIEYGSIVQKHVAKFLGWAPEVEYKIWECGGKEVMRNALAQKRKTMVNGVRKAIEKCKFNVCTIKS